MIKYLGSKRRLVPHILGCVERLPGVRTVLDLFSGTSRVGHALKARGYRVVANDHNAYAWVLARCYVQADAARVLGPARRWLDDLQALPARPGWFTETFCRRARYIHPRNGGRIEAIRDALARASLEPDLEAVLLTSLLVAADRVDSTTGVQMAYLKRWAPRANKPLVLRLPPVLAGGGRALCREAVDAASTPADLAYLDPPYNQHSYLGNYHVWETLVRWDRPRTYGVAEKRLDCRTRRSPFNSRRRFRPALEGVLERLRARYVLLSFSDEGFLERREIEALLVPHGAVAVLEVDQARYVGARIGIHNPRGEKVGRVGRLRNREFLFVLARDGRDLEALAGLPSPPRRVPA